MNFYIDTIGKPYYSGLSMQNLKEIKKKLEDRLRVLQHDLGTINQAIDVEERLNGSSDTEFLDNLRKGDLFLEGEEIERVILKMPGDFTSKGVQAAIEASFPGRTASANAVATALHQLINAKKLRYFRERKGQRPAIYRKF